MSCARILWHVGGNEHLITYTHFLLSLLFQISSYKDLRVLKRENAKVTMAAVTCQHVDWNMSTCYINNMLNMSTTTLIQAEVSGQLVWLRLQMLPSEAAATVYCVFCFVFLPLWVRWLPWSARRHRDCWMPSMSSWGEKKHNCTSQSSPLVSCAYTKVFFEASMVLSAIVSPYSKKNHANRKNRQFIYSRTKKTCWILKLRHFTISWKKKQPEECVATNEVSLQRDSNMLGYEIKAL